MIQTLKKLIPTTILYVQIWENRIKVTDVKSKNIFDDAPLMAIEHTPKNQLVVIEVGAGSKKHSASPNTVVINPFEHPRTILSDFQVAEKLLQYAIKTLLKDKFFAPSPKVVIHPMEKTEGGLTQVEGRALRELGLSTGAQDVALCTGAEKAINDLNFDAIRSDETNLIAMIWT